MKGTRWVLLLVVSLAILGGGFFYFLGAVVTVVGKPEKGNVAVVEILGGIYDPKPVVEQLESLRKDGEIKAIVLRIDSPGGSVGAAQEIYEMVRELRGVKPVVTSMGTVAASGGYYVAAPSQRIVANPGTLTGSIGVRMELMNIEELLQWARLKPQTLKSGLLKDVGSPTRPMTPEERDYLQAILKTLHEQFKQAVAESRGLKPEEVERIADGRVLTGAEAREMKLVDEIGGLSRAIKIAGELAGIRGEPEFFFSKPERRPWEYLMEGFAESLSNRLLTAWSSPWAVSLSLRGP